MQNEVIERAREHFTKIVTDQLARVERMKQGQEPVDFTSLKPIIIGFCWGDGIGPIISRETQRVLEYLLKEEIEKGKVDFRVIEGLTIENRVKHLKAIPDDVLAELKACHVILKAPTTTPEKGGPYPNIESANVAMRRELDLFANVRPVKVPKDNIDWVFYRENTEGAYILGSKGIQVTPDLAIDFTATTLQGSERIIRMAFDYAARNNINKVTVVTKANVIKTTDGLFLETAERIAKEYPAVKWDAWYIDIMTAKLIDPKRRTQFRVVVLPNLYGDIITDEAAEFQGGVGTAGSVYRHPLRHVRGHPRFGPAHDRGGTRPIRRSLQPHPRRRDDAAPHRHRRQGRAARDGPRPLQPIREGGGDHRPRGRSHRPRLLRLSARDGQGSLPEETLAGPGPLRRRRCLLPHSRSHPKGGSAVGGPGSRAHPGSGAHPGLAWARPALHPGSRARRMKCFYPINIKGVI